MAVTLSLTLRNAQAAANLTALGNNPRFSVYGNTRPASPDVAPGATPLVVAQLTGSAGSVANGVATINAFPGTPITTSGTAVWGRYSTAAGIGVIDVDISVSAGPGEVKVATTTFTKDVTLNVEAFALTEG